jgi:Ger(x)C family germination protein
MIKNYLNKLNKIAVIIILSIVLIIYFNIGESVNPVEELDIPSAIGVDIEFEQEGNETYSIPISFYNYNTQPNVTSYVFTGTGKTIGETRETRQVKRDKKFILGLEKSIIFGEKAARFDIRPVVNVLFNNPTINDIGFFVVCKGKSVDVLNLTISGYPSSGDYISSLVKHSSEQNFFSAEYKLIDLYARLSSEGENIVAPYIEVKNNTPEITGVALFKGNKMTAKLDLKEAKIMNILRETNVKGIVSLKQDIKTYTEVAITSKRKVKVSKNNDKYDFTINLNVDGYVLTNLIYKNLYSNAEVIKELDNDVKNELEKECNKFIQKLQVDYQVDCLNLGGLAASKYGRFSNKDWNKVISESTINVNVNVKISLRGRGDFK